eukprot:TRINITY_DN10121_c0_g1_i2.p1 TRINITY_DN10121_c0_g1~~TRINITY_DN10121_c0_g1_i2.p1  ORF type:complete len:1868 (-),score=465.54 TRINITY_DN10121_c0_g1_i2:72-5675(-)
MEFPDPVKLYPGMSYAPEVKFRPIKSEEYQDFIEVTVMTSLGEDHFYVPLNATLPVSALVIPEKFDFGTCPANETQEGTFLIANTGDVPIRYRWSTPELFTIAPAKGELAPGQTKTVHATFTPATATYFTGTAQCHIGSSEPVSMQLLGVCKYPHLSVDGEKELTLDFGDIFIGKSKELTFDLYNPTSVYAAYDIKTVSSFHSELFTTTPSQARVEPGATQTVTVKYTPHSAGMLSIDTKKVEVSGGNSLDLQFRGKCVGPLPSLSASSVDFGDVKMGTTQLRRLTIYNSAPVPAVYELDMGKDGVFHCDKPAGTIPAGFEVTLTFSCSPILAINYYRRVHVLVRHAEALAFDLLVTCFDDKTRPPPFDISHVRAYQTRTGFEKRREVHNPPLALPIPPANRAGRATALSFVSDTLGTAASEGDSEGLGPLDDEDMRVISSRDLTQEYFHANTDDTTEVYFEQGSVDFGYQNRNIAGEYRDITVYNRNKFKVQALWVMPGEATPSRADQASKVAHSGTEVDTSDLQFIVLPRVADIPANGSYTFRVAFRPQLDNFYFGAQLECFVTHKANRSFRLINYETFVPPFCLTLPVFGHTFNPKREQYLPMVEVPSKRLTFPGVLVGESAYQVFELRNKGVTPMRFHIPTLGNEEGESTFVCKPSKGTVPPESTSLIYFRFTPRKPKSYTQKATCLLNNSSASGIKIQLIGTGFKHGVEVGNNGHVFLPPTCLGEVSQRDITLRNPLRVPIAYTWYIPERISSLIGVFPAQGILEGNDDTPIEFSFAPKHARMYDMKVHLYVDVLAGQYQGSDPEDLVRMLQNAPGPDAVTSTVTVTGEGSAGSVKIVPSVLTFPPVLVGQSETVDITLVNSSNVGMTYGIAVEYIPDDDNDSILAGGASVTDVDALSGSKVIQISPPTVFLHARGTEKVSVTFTPDSNRKYKFKLYVSGAADVLERLQQSGIPAEAADCTIEATGQYPVLRVADLYCGKYSTARLAHMMSVDDINVALSSAPSQAMAEAIVQGKDVDADADVDEIEFNFGTARLNTETTEVRALFQNTSAMPISFAIKMPNDIEVLPEHWVDTGEPTEEELQHNMILDSQIFTISPKTGTIAPNELVEVTLTYSHNIAGVHQLPVMIVVDKGKRVRLHFTGETFWPTQQVVAFDRTVHEFDPVSLACTHPPVQSVIIHNPGNGFMDYALDAGQLEQITKDNYGYEVLSCENPSGRLAPGERTKLRFIFQPIEEKVYEFDVTVSDPNGKAVRQLKIRGQGFLPQEYGDVLRSQRKRESRLTLCSMFPAISRPNGQPQIGNDCVVTASQQYISYGHIPQHSINRQIVTLTNTSETETVDFEWQLPDDIAQDVVRINPARGTLEPQEQVVVKFIMIPGGRVEVFDIDALCVIGSPEDHALAQERQRRYESALAHLEQEQDSLVSQNDSSLFADGKGGDHHANGNGNQGRAPSVVDSLHPDFGGRASTGLSRPETTMTTGSRLAWGDIGAAAHLGQVTVNVRAMSYDNDQFQREMPGCDIRSFFIPREDDPELFAIASAPPMHDTFGEDAEDVAAFLSDTLGTMLREVIADPAVHSVLESLEPQPLVHFKRWATREGVGEPRARTPLTPSEGGSADLPGDGHSPMPDHLRNSHNASRGLSPAVLQAHDSQLNIPGPDDLIAQQISVENVVQSDLQRASGAGVSAEDSAGEGSKSAGTLASGSQSGDPASQVSASVESVGFDMQTPRLAEGAFLQMMERPVQDPLATIPGGGDTTKAQARRAAREARTRAALERPDFEETVEYILEGTLENLVAEVLAGDFNLQAPPRRIATKVSVVQQEIEEAARSEASRAPSAASYVHSAAPRSRPPSGGSKAGSQAASVQGTK